MSLTRNLSETQRERVSERARERAGERNSAHLPVCESSLSSVSTVHGTQGTRNVAAMLSAMYCGVGAVDSEEKKQGDM